MATAHDQQPIWRDPRYNDQVTFYDRFMKFAQYSVAAVIVVLALMAFFLL